jgi:hypothetical protein
MMAFLAVEVEIKIITNKSVNTSIKNLIIK